MWLIIALILVSRLSGAVFGTVTNAATWYVDSVNGSDSSTGHTATTAFQTIGKLNTQTIASGDSVCLMRGSSWREEAGTTNTHQAFMACGSGASPILDAADLISTGAWSKTGGYTNIHQAPITVANTLGYIKTWENAAGLPRASSLSDLDAATTGSYFPSGDPTGVGGGTASFTLYVNATGSGNPASNGKTYEFNARAGGFISSHDYASLIGVTTKRNLTNNGSISMAGRYGWISNVTALDGTKHNILIGAGGTIEDTTANGSYYGGQQTTLFVFNADIPASENVTFRRITGVCTVANTVGIIGHRNGASGDFGVGLYESPVFTGCNAAINDMGSAAVYLFSPSISGGLFGISVYQPFYVTGGSISSTQRTFQVQDLLSVSGTSITVTAANSGVVYAPGVAGSRLTFQDSTINCSPGNSPVVWDDGTSVTLTFLRNTITGGCQGFFLPAYGAFTVTSDYNDWTAANYNNFRVDGVSVSFSSWRSNTGQDSHSTP